MIHIVLPGNFTMEDDGFRCNGNYYNYEDIIHLRTDREYTEEYVPINPGKEGDLRLQIDIKNGEQILLTEKLDRTAIEHCPLLVGMNGIYDRLRFESFDERLYLYKIITEQNGYFTYDGYRFDIKKMIITNNFTEYSKIFYEFIKTDGFIELKPILPNPIYSLKSAFFGKKVKGIDILTDTDVILMILNSYYGILYS